MSETRDQIIEAVTQLPLIEAHPSCGAALIRVSNALFDERASHAAQLEAMQSEIARLELEIGDNEETNRLIDVVAEKDAEVARLKAELDGIDKTLRMVFLIEGETIEEPAYVCLNENGDTWLIADTRLQAVEELVSGLSQCEERITQLHSEAASAYTRGEAAGLREGFYGGCRWCCDDDPADADLAAWFRLYLAQRTEANK